jgi:triacylglycerol lipase
MSILGFVPSPSAVTPTASIPASLQLRVHDILASTYRLWVRGQLIGVPPHPAPPKRWWHRNTAEPPTPTVQLETQVSGKSLTADVPLGPLGDFEASFDVELPPARRGWRVARNQVTHAGHFVEACGLVLTPPEDFGPAVVLLPRGDTLNGNGAQHLERSAIAARLAAPLRQLQREHRTLYYIASVPVGADVQQAELALAATSIGWPNGHFVLVPADPDHADAALEHALDHLRWLFARSPDLLLVNLDPASRPLLGQIVDVEDRAKVRALVLPFGDGSSPSATGWGDIQTARSIRSGRITRYPLVFCHGMLACALLRGQIGQDHNYFSILKKFLHERRFRALFPMVAPTGGVAARAQQLRDQITQWTDEPVNVIAHSMGGLDARHAITHLGLADRVKTLTTLSTPHRGTLLADWFLQNYRNRVPLLLALEALGTNVDGFRDCRPEVCREFNARTPDAPQVRYFSFAGDVPLVRVTPMLRRGWEMISAVEGPNDGMVSVQSARWGEFLGTVSADHFAQMPDGLFLHPGETFDALGYVMRVVENLVRRGF